MAVSRRTVTILFADVADSTPLGERLDPEALRRVMTRWFDDARGAIEAHGGTVEKFIGDAVMAVFGVPQVHEDDAARAVRAANELRAKVTRLNRELARDHGLEIAVRVGVNTGEVVAGDGAGGHALVTGDAVNVAKRLEEAARPGEILVGSATEQLTRAAATYELVQPLEVKGKAAAVEAWRLIAADGIGRALDRRTPFVGRGAELRALHDAHETAVTNRSCHRFVLLGDAGVGKSRLACELFDALGDHAIVLTGRCLPYGEGITFWPLQEVFRQLGGERGIMQLLQRHDDAQLICDRLTGTADGQATFWAVRRLCETLGRERPLVLCLEDVHWAESTLLDLVEYLTGWVRDAPVLLLCLARPEFVDARPAWFVGDHASAALTLAPLAATDAETLLDALGAVDPARTRITEAAEGNPLYLEQMAAMVAEGGYEEGFFTVPPTIQALLAARLDRLSDHERTAVERAAVIGKEFWRGALDELTPDGERSELDSALMSLVRKDFIRPHQSALVGDDAFRFSHVLVRDAAYAAIPKEVRATLHERHAGWLERNAPQDTELEEIVGYHLEQAFRYREQLGPVDDDVRAMSARAGELLGRAGRRAFARDDISAAVNLLDRAVSLATEQAPAQIELRRELSLALWSLGEIARAEALLDGVIEAAGTIGDRRLQWYSILDRAAHRATLDASDGDKVAEDALAVFEELGDDLGRAQAWRQISSHHQSVGHYAESARAAEKALDYARRAHDARLESRCVDSLCTCLLYGPAPADEATGVCESLLRDAAGKPLLEANVLASLGGLEAMRGDFDDARAHLGRAETIYGELGLRLAEAGLRHVAAGVELLADDPGAAERLLWPAYDLLANANAHGFTGLLLVDALLAQDRTAQADELFASIEPALQDDVASTVYRCMLGARLRARGGDPSAVALAKSAVELVRTTDALNVHAAALEALGEALARNDRAADAGGVLAEAVELYVRKGNVVAATRSRTRLPQLDPR